MKWIDEFKRFALKGNVVDLAIGVVIGAAFGQIVTSLVNDIFMPPLGLIIGGVHFGQLKVVLQDQPLVSVNYGNFVQNIVHFLIIAFAMFFVIKVVNRLSKPNVPSAPPEEITLLREIRDLLKKD